MDSVRCSAIFHDYVKNSISKYLILLKLIDLVVDVSFQQSMQLLLSSMLIISPYLQPLLILSRIKHFIKPIDDLVRFDSAKELMGMKIIG